MTNWNPDTIIIKESNNMIVITIENIDLLEQESINIESYIHNAIVDAYEDKLNNPPEHDIKITIYHHITPIKPE